MCMCVSVCIVYVQVPSKSRKMYWVPCKWSYRRREASPMWVLGTEHCPSAKAARTSRHQAIFLSPCPPSWWQCCEDPWVFWVLASRYPDYTCF